MSLSPAEATHLSAQGLPILCVDTCTLLDVIRDITRESIRLSDAQSGFHILNAAEAGGKVIVVMAEQVSRELAANAKGVYDEAELHLKNFREQAQRIHDISVEFGAAGTLATGHLIGHVGRAQVVLNRWTAASQKVAQGTEVTDRAFNRVNAARTPARKGKDSIKDCVVIETYLETAQQLRAAGLTSKIVFASSNTKDYCGSGTSHLQADIAADFRAHAIEYAPNFGAIRGCLKI
ncbi:PIN domain-containing protein [Rhizobacter fulvus]